MTMATKAERYNMYYYNRRYTNTNMTRLKGSKKNNKKEGRRELVRDTLDYMAQDVQYMMLEKKRMEEEALGFGAFLGTWMTRLKDVVKRKTTIGKRGKLTINPAMESRRYLLITKQI